LREQQIDPAAARLLAEDQARLFTALPIGFEDNAVVVALADPTNDVLTRNVREAVGQEVRLVVAARSELNEMIGEVFSGALEVAPAAPEPEPELPPLRVDTSVAPVEPEAAVPDVEPAPDPAPEPAPEHALEAEPVVEPEPVVEVTPEPVVEVTPEPLVEPEPAVEAEAEPEPEFDASEYEFDAPAPQPEPEPEPQPEAVPEPVMEAAPEPPEPTYETPAEPEPFVAPLATEPVAPQSIPQSNGHVPEDFEDDTPPPAPASGGAFRVSIRLTSGERVTVADCDDIGEAKGYAKALTKQLGATENDDWPFVNGRFLKPDTIISVDVEELQ
jgi:hypothetical protein